MRPAGLVVSLRWASRMAQRASSATASRLSHRFRESEQGVHAIESAPASIVASTAERLVEGTGTVQNSMHSKVDRASAVLELTPDR
jgi:hypothetical protein